MNTIVKSAVAAALALGASGAFAIGLPSTNSSDMILLVENTTTGASYALDTGVTLNALLPTASLVANASLSTALAGVNTTVAASSTLQSFLAANPASGDGWELIGGQFPGGTGGVANNSTTKAPGAGKVAYTSTLPVNQATHTLANMNSILNGLVTEMSASGGTLNGLLTAAELTGQNVAPKAITKWGVVQGDVLGALGQAQTFFGFTGNGTTGALQSYVLGSATLAANGTLSLSGNSTGPAPDSYNVSTRSLTCPTLAIGSATYTDVAVTVGNIVTLPSGSAPSGSEDSYDPGSGYLTVQSVVVGGKTYFNAVVSVSALDSIGGVTGADSYDGIHLTISSVQVGSKVYNNAVITVAGIVSLERGMPKAALDSYDLTSHLLTIAAVEFGGNVYTNVVVKVGTIVSVAGVQLSPSAAPLPQQPDFGDRNLADERLYQ